MIALPSTDALRTMKGEPVLCLVRDILAEKSHALRSLEDQLSGHSGEIVAVIAAIGAASDIITHIIGVGQDEKVHTPKGGYGEVIKKDRLKTCAQIADQARAALVQELTRHTPNDGEAHGTEEAAA